MAQKPRKLMRIKPSKYEGSGVIQSYKKYWNDVFNELTDNVESVNRDKNDPLTEALPSDLCERVCNVLGIGIASKETLQTRTLSVQQQRRLVKEPLLSQRKKLYIDRELDSDTDVEFISDCEENSETEIHREFLKKPIREQVTWATRFLEPEKDHEKNLIRRADDVTDRIAQEFSDYMKQLGGDQQSQLSNTKAIKELFQIEFDTHVSRGLQVVPKELPTVVEKIAVATDAIEKSRPSALQREISKDIEAEKLPDYLLAFGKSIPRRSQWKNPRNNTESSWRSARHVPRDLFTLKTVWDGITNLRSVKEYCRWMIDHPEHKRPPYLNSLGMFDQGVLDARLTIEMQEVPRRTPVEPVETPAPVDQIRKRLSELVDTD